MKLKAKVPPVYDNFTLLDYISRRFAYLTRQEWRKRIRQRRHSRNGAVLYEDDIVYQNDEIAYDLADDEQEEANFDYKILVQTKDFLAIDKPPKLMVHRNKSNFRNNLIFQLRQTHNPPFPAANTVNRLDRDTSGIVLVSLNKKALASLTKQFAERTVQKTYFAVVVGAPNPPSGEILVPLGKIEEPSPDDVKNGRFFTDEPKNPKASETYYETIRSANGHSLVKLHPKTGRTHQLRIHLAHIGTPIVADTAYGFKHADYLRHCEENAVSPIISERQLLHCAEMQFMLADEKITVFSPPPEIFEI